MSRRSADTILRHVSELVHALKAGVRPEADSVKWAQSLDGRLRSRLAACGLVHSEDTHRKQEQCRLLGPFIDRYIEERTDAKPSTITNYKHAKRWLVQFFGKDKLLIDVTPADCDRLQRFLTDGDRLAASTAEKILKRAKTMFRHAVRDRLLEENPFADLKIGSTVNRDRDAYISRPLAAAVMKACPDDNWRVIFALARFGGMRTPSEVLNLAWEDVDWKQLRLRIDSPKTGFRTCPLFPELLPLLKAAWKANGGHSRWVVNEYRSSEKNLRTRMRRIIEDAGLEAWPKLFVNLRASRRTELQEEFPDHVVNSWLGHSSRIAEKHYLQVTPDHWEKAIGGNICANPQASTPLLAHKKQEIRRPEGDRFPVISRLAPPLGLEPRT
ncbi:tyrosine-type recombinase/integrase [Fuerstiella marisgermanici]|uniref:tyrosine-type recombinase/integrase n=1 Tax=Fuerstiella marisgermanici TaxID=1891926 RepID=UPI001C54C79B|nr:phage integrase SAM-like domain-containing protein [Fuerstiella marisgermanici]